MVKQRKKIGVFLWVLLFAIGGCKGQEGPQQKVSEYYSSLTQGSVGATVTADSGVIMEYELSVSWQGEESQCTVVSPEEIAGVSCHISQGGATLQFEDVQLDTLLAPIQGFTPVDCTDGLLRTLAGAAPTQWGREKKEGQECISLTYEMEADGKKAVKQVWLREDTLEPVCARWFLEGDQIMHAVFSGFSAMKE